MKDSDNESETQIDSNVLSCKGDNDALSESDDSVIDEEISSRYGISLYSCPYSLLLHNESSGCYDIKYLNDEPALPIFSHQS